MSEAHADNHNTSPPDDHTPAMFCRDCRSPLHATTISRCPRCGRPYNPANPRTYVTSPTARRFSWHGVISWGVFLVAQFYGGAAFTIVGVNPRTLTPYALILAIGIVIALIGTRKPPWLNQVICFIALMAYALTILAMAMSQIR